MLCLNDKQVFCIVSYSLKYGTLCFDVEYYNQCVQKVVALSSHFKGTNVIVVVCDSFRKKKHKIRKPHYQI